MQHPSEDVQSTGRQGHRLGFRSKSTEAVSEAMGVPSATKGKRIEKNRRPRTAF